MVLMGALVLAAYSSFRKPLWIDEFLHFALGGLDVADAWAVVVNSTVGVNHGQTGVYMMLDVLLLHLFGASSLALRLPSLVAGVGLLLAGVWFLRLRGMSSGWQMLGLVALAAQTTLMYHAGEARPYMPLAAATVGCLAYYSVPIETRAAWRFQLLGIVSFILGALMHAYFPMMLALVAPFSAWVAVRDGLIARTPRSVIRFLNPPLVLLAAGFSLGIGLLTWLRGSPRFDLDPYVSFGGPAQMFVGLLARHLELLIGLPAAAVLLVVTVLALARDLESRRALASPAALVAVGLASSVIVTLASVSRSYWVFPRQWVAGMSLVALGLVWLFAEIDGAARRSSSWRLLVPSVLFRALVVASFILALAGQATALVRYQQQWQATEASKPDRLAVEVERVEDNDGWVALANVNMRTGGDVWRELARYYKDYLPERDP
jgi:hypothetical protein